MGDATVLIATTKLDPHADAVIDCLMAAGCSVFRLNTEDFITKYKFDFYNIERDKPSIFIEDEQGRHISLPDDLRAAYYRKPARVEAPSCLPDAASKQFAIAEGEECLRALYTHPRVRWVNDPFAIRKAANKCLQLQIAQEFGFRIPDTIITNNPDTAAAFLAAHNGNILCKPFAKSTIRAGNDSYQLFSHKLSSAELCEHLAQTELCPIVLQEYVDKKFEIRATIIEQRVFSCRIDSQDCCDSHVDWRQVDPFQLKHSPIILPDHLNAKLVALIRRLGLEFGAADLICTPEENYVFLENNSNGQWYWIELLTNQPMAQAMADLLLCK